MPNKAPVTAPYGDAWPSLETGDALELTTIDKRGVKIWPDGIVKTENLRTFDGKPGCTLAQGQ